MNEAIDRGRLFFLSADLRKHFEEDDGSWINICRPFDICQSLFVNIAIGGVTRGLKGNIVGQVGAEELIPQLNLCFVRRINVPFVPGPDPSLDDSLIAMGEVDKLEILKALDLVSLVVSKRSSFHCVVLSRPRQRSVHRLQVQVR